MQHGEKILDVVAPRSRFYQGGFGRLFPELEPWVPDIPQPATGGIGTAQALQNHFMNFVAQNMVDATGAGGRDISLPSGYVYFGQFVDHDITHDVTPLSESEVDPNRLHNFRTPRLDLDSLYGAGTKDQPFLYEAGTGKFRIDQIQGTNFRDLPRHRGTALIGDPRNDENIIVAQLHLAFLLAHNALVDEARKQGAKNPFETARKTLRWLYQWVVWNDYVRRICRDDVHKAALRLESGSSLIKVWQVGYGDVFDWKVNPFMPVEFSVAAYRSGHTLVRGGYQTNIGNGVGPNNGFPTFAVANPNTKGDLRGGNPLTSNRVIQWDWFLQMDSSFGPDFPQVARAFDPLLVEALRHMPEDPVNPSSPTAILNVLAARNLVRGVRMQLPAASAVATKLGIEHLPIQQQEDEALWFYILREAQSTEAVGSNGERLGLLGSILVAATFAGLLKGDPLSFFNMEPGWTPDRDPLLQALDQNLQINRDAGQAGNVSWGLPAIVRLSGLPVDGSSFPQPAGGAAAAPTPATPAPPTPPAAG
ncbi:hypothetical protein CYG48_03730 [Neorhizobium sp. SOG26]|uniref:peroxidase family protein n=1 Tax=Neorhizobium sp. SOG26 TaxID=2060726 RepID=UPI000E5782CC|nr:peroxidase family protein [Neorhizobium sp. SOG26]AXV14881.1 hypothetical protein CYG48_03730 [Neorhizobium sp. SOG26]